MRFRAGWLGRKERVWHGREPMYEGLSSIEKAMGGCTQEKLGAIPELSLMIERRAIPDKDAARMLENALGDSDRQVRWSAILAISRHGARMLDGLCLGLLNDDERVKGMSAAMIHLALARNPGLMQEGIAPLDSEARDLTSVLFYSLLGDDRHLKKNSLESLCALASRSPVMVLEELEYFRGEILPGREHAGLEKGLQRLEDAAMEAIRREAKKNPV